ncbi:MAG: type VII toxin-antitoxin system HepT family RNase toxin [Gemmatimonadota bacterium]
MTSGEINLKIVTDRLAYLKQCLAELGNLPADSFEEFVSDARNPATAESFLRRGIEALIDVARHLLARAYGIAPLEYREVARQAAEKGLVSKPELAHRFEEIAGFRNRLTHYYSEVTEEELFGIVTGQLDDLAAIAAALRGSAGRLARESGNRGA